jgi:hypothetical protein
VVLVPSTVTRTSTDVITPPFPSGEAAVTLTVPLGAPFATLHVMFGGMGLAGEHDAWPPSLVPPAKHGVQWVLRPADGENVFAGHAAQLDCIVWIAYVPD